MLKTHRRYPRGMWETLGRVGVGRTSPVVGCRSLVPGTVPLSVGVRVISLLRIHVGLRLVPRSTTIWGRGVLFLVLRSMQLPVDPVGVFLHRCCDSRFDGDLLARFVFTFRVCRHGRLVFFIFHDPRILLAFLGLFIFQGSSPLTGTQQHQQNNEKPSKISCYLARVDGELYGKCEADGASSVYHFLPSCFSRVLHDIFFHATPVKGFRKSKKYKISQTAYTEFTLKL